MTEDLTIQAEDIGKRFAETFSLVALNGCEEWVDVISERHDEEMSAAVLKLLVDTDELARLCDVARASFLNRSKQIAGKISSDERGN
jgi:hypothetical protein